MILNFPAWAAEWILVFISQGYCEGWRNNTCAASRPEHRWAAVNRYLPHHYNSSRMIDLHLKSGFMIGLSSFSALLHHTEPWTIVNFFPMHSAYSNPHQEKKTWKILSMFLLTKISFLPALTSESHSQFLPPGPPSPSQESKTIPILMSKTPSGSGPKMWI